MKSVTDINPGRKLPEAFICPQTNFHLRSKRIPNSGFKDSCSFEFGYLVESELRVVGGKERRLQKKTPLSYLTAPQADGTSGDGTGGTTGGNTGGNTTPATPPAAVTTTLATSCLRLTVEPSKRRGGKKKDGMLTGNAVGILSFFYLGDKRFGGMEKYSYLCGD